MNQSLDLYLQLREQLLSRTLPHNYKIAEERKEDSFGSHYITLVKDEKAIRLVWSGHDYTFSLETCEKYSKQPFGRWHYVADEVVPYPPWNQETLNKVLKAIGDGIANLPLE